MRKLTVLLAVLSLGLVGTAWAHLPADVIYYAVQWPDELLPVLDGDLSDWDIVPDAYVQELEDMYEQLAGLGKASGLFDASDFSVRSIVGWNESTNRLYFMAEVFDDIHQTDRANPIATYTDDCWEIMLDGDHTGGRYNWFSDLTEEESKRLSGSQGQQHVMAYPPIADITWWMGNANTWIMEAANAGGPGEYDFIGHAYSFTGEEFGESTYSYEVWLYAWDDLNWEGPDVSDQHDLTEGEIVGIGYAFGDFDELSDAYDAYWTVSGGDATCGKADVIADFLLSPPDPALAAVPAAVESDTWGRIKSTFAE